MCRMEGKRDCHASDSSKAAKTDDDDRAVRWTVEEVSREYIAVSVKLLLLVYLHRFLLFYRSLF